MLIALQRQTSKKGNIKWFPLSQTDLNLKHVGPLRFHLPTSLTSLTSPPLTSLTSPTSSNSHTSPTSLTSPTSPTLAIHDRHVQLIPKWPWQYPTLPYPTLINVITAMYAATSPFRLSTLTTSHTITSFVFSCLQYFVSDIIILALSRFFRFVLVLDTSFFQRNNFHNFHSISACIMTSHFTFALTSHLY